MPTPESSPYSYTHVTREIVPTSELEQFHARVVRIGNIALGFKDSTFLGYPNWNDEIQDEEVREGLGVSAAQVYPVNTWEITQFERRVLPEQGWNTHFLKVYARFVDDVAKADSMSSKDSDRPKLLSPRLEGIARKYGMDPRQTLSLKASGVVISTKPQYTHLGDEYALQIDPDPLVDMLEEQNAVIHRIVRSTGPGYEICGNYAPLSINVPFARLPTEVSDESRDAFTSWVTKTIPPNGLSLQARPLEWGIRLR